MLDTYEHFRSDDDCDDGRDDMSDGAPWKR